MYQPFAFFVVANSERAGGIVQGLSFQVPDFRFGVGAWAFLAC